MFSATGILFMVRRFVVVSERMCLTEFSISYNNRDDGFLPTTTTAVVGGYHVDETTVLHYGH
jgi:hypothetical protein